MSTLNPRQSVLRSLASLPGKVTRLDKPDQRQERLIKYTKPHLDVAKVCNALRCHDSFELQSGYTIKGLPPFAEFATYAGLSSNEELKLAELEARRLVRIANSDAPVRIQCPDDLFGPATQQGYLMLHHLGRKLITSLLICQHDVSIIMAENMNRATSFAFVEELQARLHDECDLTTGKLRFSGSTSDDGEETAARRLHALVNHMTAVLLKVVLQGLRGPYWEENVAAIIARLAAKLKILCANVPGAVQETLQKSKEARQRISLQEQHAQRYAVKEPENYRRKSVRDDEEPEPSRRGRAGEATKYFVEISALHTAIIGMLRRSVADFAVSNPAAPGTDDFESSVALYESFITNDLVLLCEQRDGGIGAASEVGIIHACTAAWQVCLQSWEALDREHVNTMAHKWTMLQWLYSVVDDQLAGEGVKTKSSSQPRQPTRKGAVKLTSMKSVITATVPFSMISPASASSFFDLIDITMFNSGRDGRTPMFVITQPKVVCRAVMRTSTYVANRPGTVGEHDVCSVSETFLLERRAIVDAAPQASITTFNGNSGGVPSAIASGGRPIGSAKMYNQKKQPAAQKSKPDLRTQSRDENREAIGAIMSKFSTWIIDDDAIVVPYKRYAWGVLFVSAVLVLGGLGIGFSIGERIHGVDPFNITVFCWVLAGFILLVSKAVCVEVWPWSSFLRGVVPCRSVSEIVSVTGVDAQLLLAVLLRLDNRMYLLTRGPFNTLFEHQSGDARIGFSIDEPIKSSTVIEGGLLPIKVLTDWGPSLVFIDTHSWTRYNVAMHSSLFSGGNAVCRDVKQASLWRTDDQATSYRLLPLKEKEHVHITHVLGVFKQDCFFC